MLLLMCDLPARITNGKTFFFKHKRGSAPTDTLAPQITCFDQDDELVPQQIVDTNYNTTAV